MTRHRPGALARIALLVLALLCLAVGLFLVVFPGPAIPLLMIAGALLALESKPIARSMDWIELRIRAVAGWGWRHWCHSPVWARGIVLVVGVIGSATSLYVAYVFFQR